MKRILNLIISIIEAFFTAGWVLSSIMIIFLTFISYVTATFMFESMAIANAIKKFTSKETEVIFKDLIIVSRHS